MPRKSITTLSLLQKGHILYWYTVMSSPSRCFLPPATPGAATVEAAAAAEQEGTAPAAICLCTVTVETQRPAPPTANSRRQTTTRVDRNRLKRLFRSYKKSPCYCYELIQQQYRQPLYTVDYTSATLLYCGELYCCTEYLYRVVFIQLS